jgi:hypothetical protein
MIGASEQKLRQSKVAYSDAQESAPAVAIRATEIPPIQAPD